MYAGLVPCVGCHDYSLGFVVLEYMDKLSWKVQSITR